MIELETRPKFRSGESPNRPIGGNVADAPFTNAFRNVMTEAGFDSELSLARCLNKSNNNAVSNWLTGKHFPRPEEVGGLIVVFVNAIGVDNEKLEVFLNAYADTLRERELGIAGRRSPFEKARKIRKSMNTPVSEWIENFCEQEGSSLSGFFRRIGCSDVHVPGRGGFSSPTLVDIEVGLQSQYGKETSDSFHRAVDREKKEKQEEGKSVKASSVRGMIRKQRESKETLYNGQEAANIVHTTRETIRNHRGKHGWGKLLTKDQVEILRSEIKIGQEVRENNPQEAFPNEVQIYPLAS